jgi:hypothetical protein
MNTLYDPISSFTIGFITAIAIRLIYDALRRPK